MNCPYCGKETDPQNPFCVHCGSPMPQAAQPPQATAQGAPPPPGVGRPQGGQPADATVVVPPRLRAVRPGASPRPAAAGRPVRSPAEAGQPVAWVIRSERRTDFAGRSPCRSKGSSSAPPFPSDCRSELYLEVLGDVSSLRVE